MPGSHEYNAGQRPGRTFDDGQGARLLRPENRVDYVAVDSKDKALTAIRDALVVAGIMKDA